MRFRPANISLINRRHYLPRLLLTLSPKRQMQKQKPPQRFEDADRGHTISTSGLAVTRAELNLLFSEGFGDYHCSALASESAGFSQVL